MSNYVKLPNLLKGKDELLLSSIEELKRILQQIGRIMTIHLHIVGEEHAEHDFSIVIKDEEANIVKKQIDNPDISVITTDEAWTKIASGEISPVDTLLNDKLRFIGDLDLARSILTEIGVSGNKVFPCDIGGK